MINKLKNNSGSTLVMLVMTVAVISLLGTSILGVTLMNYKIKKTNTDMKYSFYMSESGLDRAYAAAYALILDAVKLSDEAAQNKIDEFNHEKLLDILVNGTEIEKMYYLEDDDGDGVYNFKQDVIKAEAKKAFEDKYMYGDNIFEKGGITRDETGNIEKTQYLRGIE